MQNDLTVTSAKLLTDLIVDAPNWAGMPHLGSSTVTGTALKGNVTDLKKKGYIETDFDEGCTWVIFTEKAADFAAANGMAGNCELPLA